MKKYETGYKIVNKQSLTSAVISGKDCALKYKVNKWVKPLEGNGPLCVFNTIGDAKNFKWISHIIYECLYERSLERNAYIKNVERKHLLSLPQGTVLANKVKLIRRIR